MQTTMSDAQLLSVSLEPSVTIWLSFKLARLVKLLEKCVECLFHSRLGVNLNSYVKRSHIQVCVECLYTLQYADYLKSQVEGFNFCSVKFLLKKNQSKVSCLTFS